MRRATLAIATLAAATRVVTLLVAVTLGGCTAPDYGDGHLQCAAARACPAGFYCAGDDHCWRDDSGPPGGDDAGADLSVPSDLAGDVFDSPVAAPTSAAAPRSAAARWRCSARASRRRSTSASTAGRKEPSANSTVTIDNTRAFRGTSSLKSHIAASGAGTSPHAEVNTT